jgi:hypothetical protein
MFLSVLSLNQLKANGGSDGLAPISRPGYKLKWQTEMVSYLD